jgi:hypothetical protein
VTILIQIAAILAILGAGAVYGTDVFCAIALRPALARVDDATLTPVMGNVHRYADARMRIPGVVSLLFAAIATVSAATTGHATPAIAAGSALVLLIVWMVLYVRISAPINRRLTQAVDAHETLPGVRGLQRDWDRIITLRATLQGLALLGLSLALITL